MIGRPWHLKETGGQGSDVRHMHGVKLPIRDSRAGEAHEALGSRMLRAEAVGGLFPLGVAEAVGKDHALRRIHRQAHLFRPAHGCNGGFIIEVGNAKLLLMLCKIVMNQIDFVRIIRMGMNVRAPAQD